MTTRAFSASRVGQNFEAVAVSWAGLLNGDDGAPFEMPSGRQPSVHFAGTFGAGGAIVFEGSNDGTNYVTLNDTGGTTISKTSAALVAVREVPRYVRPRVTAGDGTTTLVCTMTMGR
ncbi:hypothetical protein [Neoroseomonas oryzicola]|uniref:Uncharacterized protein n=1 Tax=Neoroseomonas oryzicola TaxID=535904 RepID=A0A9X9WIQ8_9PROT|nr:hypothetical protein [Neoroseomonas oryzicola]MBR0660218.1 hypothetical protein [Neoroseomonas oryzicola]NKE16707.1 hypothetical protein [Neoroseomonas oryzicola]